MAVDDRCAMPAGLGYSNALVEKRPSIQRTLEAGKVSQQPSWDVSVAGSMEYTGSY